MTRSTHVHPPVGATTHLPQGLTLTGDVAAAEDLVIDGIISGTIDMPAHAITIGESARVDARIFARDVTVLGAVTGRVTATEIIEIRAGAQVSGELAAPAVVLADGARVQGRIDTKRVDAAVHVARYRMRNASA
jgi:cytoskeletal protein CcmA (bactofilin family)